MKRIYRIAAVLLMMLALILQPELFPGYYSVRAEDGSAGETQQIENEDTDKEKDEQITDRNGNGIDDRKDRFRVVYDLDGGTTSSEHTVWTDLRDRDVTPTIVWPVRKHYILKGFEPDIYLEVRAEDAAGSADKLTITYKAIWAADDNNNGQPDEDERFYVSYDLDGGDTASPRTTFHDLRIGDDTPTIRKPKKKGYTFKGWEPPLADKVAASDAARSKDLITVEYKAVWEKKDSGGKSNKDDKHSGKKHDKKGGKGKSGKGSSGGKNASGGKGNEKGKTGSSGSTSGGSGSTSKGGGSNSSGSHGSAGSALSGTDGNSTGTAGSSQSDGKDSSVDSGAGSGAEGSQLSGDKDGTSGSGINESSQGIDEESDATGTERSELRLRILLMLLCALLLCGGIIAAAIRRRKESEDQ